MNDVVFLVFEISQFKKIPCLKTNNFVTINVKNMKFCTYLQLCNDIIFQSFKFASHLILKILTFKWGYYASKPKTKPVRKHEV